MKTAALYAICGTNRPELAKRLTHNLIETSQCDIVLIASPKLKNFDHLKTLKYNYSEWVGARIILFPFLYSVGFAQAANYGWAKLREKVGTDKNILAFLTSDDYEFYDGWYEAALCCYNEYFPDRDGLMFMRDHHAPDNRPKTGIAIVSAKFCDLYMRGWIAPPWYITSGIDIEYKGLAEKYDKCEACPDAHVRHLLHEWEKTRDSEQRKLGLLMLKDREKRDWVFDFDAPWRYWNSDKTLGGDQNPSKISIEEQDPVEAPAEEQEYCKESEEE